MTKRKAARPSSRPTLAEQADRHVLYQEAVQNPEFEVEFFEERFEELRGRKALSMREDFCGTALLSVEWCKSDPERTALGVDNCPDTLAWGREHNIEPAGEDVDRRLQIEQADVRDITEPKVDVACAMNFSYLCFKTRDELRGYFEVVHKGLKDDGIFILDLLGGTATMDVNEDVRELEEIDAEYIWDQAEFNPINNELNCNIHFEFADGSRLDNAFSYTWRLWSLPEVRELLEEAGFSKVRVYWEEFEDDGDPDSDYLEGTGNYIEVEEVEQQEAWITYIVAEA